MDFLKRVSFALVVLVLGVVAGAGACGFDPQIADGAFTCAADRSCPNGFVCAGDNKCYRPGNGPPVVTGDGGGPDSAPPFVPSKLQADPITLPEGNGGTTDFVFTVRLDKASTREVSVDYSTNDGTAKANEDYASAAGKLVFPPGSTSQTITVKVTADRFEEPDETFTVKLSNPVNAVLLPGAGPDITATIKNDDSPGLAIDDVKVTEGDVDTVATLTVSLSGSFTTDVTVNFATVEGTALAGSDYLATSDVLTFAPGDKTKTISIPIKGDLAYEKEEALTVKLSVATGAPLADDQATITITDNDPIPSISVADATIAEGDVGDTNMTFVVSLSAASSEEVKVSFTTGGGTAGATDYSATSGTLTFPPGATTQNISVPITGDLVDELDETFTVTLATPVNGTISKTSATGTITDDDAPPVLTVADVALAEGNTGTTNFPFVFTLSGPSAKTASFTYTTANGTATSGSDYVAATATVTFLPGEITKTVNVVVNGDGDKEPAETFNVNLTNATNLSFDRASALGTIVNDDGAAALLSINDVSITEGNGGQQVLSFTVTCTGTGSGITVDYATSNATATASSGAIVGDYEPVSGTLPAFNCSTPQTINVTINGDVIDEGASETFQVNLSNPNTTDTAITKSQGVGTITDDDGAPQIDIVPSVVATEGDVGSKTFGFDVTLSNPSSTAVTVAYATSPGVTSPATAGTDYVTTSGTLTFSPGETSKTVNVTVNGDVVYEPDETFKVTLSTNSSNSTLGTAVGVGTITNDEPEPTISITDVTATEGNNGSKNFTFAVTLSGASSTNVSVGFATSNGTATAGNDYTAKSGTLVFAPGGALTQNIDIAVTGDAVFEADETFSVLLSSPVGASIADATGVGTITNDDQARLISINDVSVAENNSNGFIRFTLTMSPTINSSTSVNWTVIHTTTSDADFTTTPLSGIATFAANSSTTTITLNLLNDTLDEVDESFEVHLSNPTNNAQIADGVGVGTITDEDPTPTLTIVAPAATAEGDSGSKNFTFDIKLSKASGRTVTVQYATQDGPGADPASSSNPGKDYNATSGTLTFAPGEILKQVSVSVQGDNTKEKNETFSMVLSNAVGATIQTATGVATINNDD